MRLNYVTKSMIPGLLLFAITLSGCDLDMTNPNTASEEEVLNTREGIINLATGIQTYHATSFLEASVVDPGLTSFELATTTTLANYLEMESGRTDLQTENPNVLRVWARSYRMMNMAEQLIENTGGVELNPGTQSGIIALAHFHKAAALGVLGQNFLGGALSTDQTENAEIVDRMALFAEAVSLLDDAIDLLESTPISAEFENRILGSEFDLENTLHAYKARFLLFSGEYQAAYNAAGEVDLTASSWFTLDAQNRNPIYNIYSETGLEYVAPRNGFGTPLVEDGDARLAFYMDETEETSVTDVPIGELRGFFTSESANIPAYLAGEMMLIQAEAIANLQSPADAVPYIDMVRTKTAEDDPYGLGAGLDSYEGGTDLDSIMEEIYRQRAAELFLTGLRLEDSRRLDRPGPNDAGSERNRNFYPFPERERLNNPDNVPPNPQI